MAQTAITKAIEQIKGLHVKYDHLDNMLLNRDDTIDILTDLLPYERETIEAAYRDGSKDMDKAHWQVDREHSDSQDYFTKTYNQND
jgi:hypothetical protein